jgi:NAD(P)-dependent dehydrogenase (short-subunit alcohol dehydrogenase family)
MDLGGRVAFVTGGSGGIGTRIAHALASAGADIAVGYNGDHRAALNTCAIVKALGRRAEPVQLEQATLTSAEAAVDASANRFGRLDILVNNAAWNIGIPFADLEALTVEIWDRMFATNTRGPFVLARAAARHMLKQEAGRIVNIASVGGLIPASSSIAYSCSKAALIHLTRCLAVALGPDITVNCVAPGLVEGTRMAARLPEPVVQVAKQRAVLKRTASADDIAQQVLAFCRSDSVTGQVLTVDAGVHFH